MSEMNSKNKWFGIQTSGFVRIGLSTIVILCVLEMAGLAGFAVFQCLQELGWHQDVCAALAGMGGYMTIALNLPLYKNYFQSR